jgi:hypothetical protein
MAMLVCGKARSVQHTHTHARMHIHTHMHTPTHTPTHTHTHTHTHSCMQTGCHTHLRRRHHRRRRSRHAAAHRFAVAAWLTSVKCLSQASTSKGWYTRHTPAAISTVSTSDSHTRIHLDSKRCMHGDGPIHSFTETVRPRFTAA